MTFTSLTIAARYGSSEGAGLRLPATVSRNTPAAETRLSMGQVFGAGTSGDDVCRLCGLSRGPTAARRGADGTVLEQSVLRRRRGALDSCDEHRNDGSVFTVLVPH